MVVAVVVVVVVVEAVVVVRMSDIRQGPGLVNHLFFVRFLP